MKKGIIFDLDGTLWDSTKQVIPAWNRVLARHEEIAKRITNEDMSEYMGKTIEVIAALAFPDMEKSESVKILLECCEEEDKYLREYGGELYSGLEDVLGRLKDKYSLYVVSNCHEGYLNAFLDFHRLSGYFEDVECAGRTGMEKADNIKLIIERNSIDRAVYVGDTALDKESAELAGIPFIYASYGFGRLEGENHVIDRFEAVEQKASRLLDV